MIDYLFAGVLVALVLALVMASIAAWRYAKGYAEHLRANQ